MAIIEDKKMISSLTTIDINRKSTNCRLFEIVSYDSLNTKRIGELFLICHSDKSIELWHLDTRTN